MKDLKSYLHNVVDPISKDPMRKNHVLVVIKPGFYNIVDTLFSKFIENGYKIVKTKTKKLLLSEAEELYKVHSQEDFYEDLCKYMSSDLSMAMILYKKSDNIFKEFETLKDKIREEYGESDMRNVLHSSDSYKSFTHESQVYFYNVNQQDLLK
jgi:nucleoside diphosphate kinase